MMRLRQSQKQTGAGQAGFTIIELMIATVVFSVILIIITAGIIAITKTYYKGVTQNRTQNVARSVMDSLSQAVQFSGGNVVWPQATVGIPVTQGRGCIGDTAYDFQLGKLLSNDSTYTDAHAANTLSISAGGATCVAGTAPSFTDKSSEQLSKQMRLIRLNVSPVSLINPNHLWQVEVTVAFGDNDLLCDNSVPPTNDGSCAAGSTTISPAMLANFPAGHMLTCRSGSGSSFCAVSALSTIVQQRLVPGA